MNNQAAVRVPSVWRPRNLFAMNARRRRAGRPARHTRQRKVEHADLVQRLRDAGLI